MHHLQQSLRRQVELARPHTDAFEHQASRVRSLRQGFRPQVVPLQARGVVLHARSPPIVLGEARPGRSADLVETECCVTVVLEQAANDAVRHRVAHQRHSPSAGTRTRPEELGLLRDHQAHQDDGRGDALEATLQRENALSGRSRETKSGLGDEGPGIRVEDGHQDVGDISQSGAPAPFRKRRQEFLEYIRLPRPDKALGFLEAHHDDLELSHRLGVSCPMLMLRPAVLYLSTYCFFL